MYDKRAGKSAGSRISFTQGLKEAIADEREAAEFYGRLAQEAPNRALANRIKDIQADERNHYLILSEILEEQSPSWVDELRPVAMQSFIAGVKMAYEDEVGAIAFYANLSLEAPDYATSARIRDIMRDETVHAEFFAQILAMAGVR